MYKAIRERVAKDIYEQVRQTSNLLSELLNRFVKTPDPRYECFATPLPEGAELDSTLKKIYLIQADQILSIRLNDKGEPDPVRRYGIAVVDRKAISKLKGILFKRDLHHFVPFSPDTLKEIEEAGFVKEVSRDGGI